MDLGDDNIDLDDPGDTTTAQPIQEPDQKRPRLLDSQNPAQTLDDMQLGYVWTTIAPTNVDYISLVQGYAETIVSIYDSVTATIEAYWLANEGKAGFVDQRLSFLQGVLPALNAFYQSSLGAYVQANWAIHEYINQWTIWLHSVTSWDELANGFIAALLQEVPAPNRHLAGNPAIMYTMNSYLMNNLPSYSILTSSTTADPGDEFWELGDTAAELGFNAPMSLEHGFTWGMEIYVSSAEPHADFYGLCAWKTDFPSQFQLAHGLNADGGLKVPKLFEHLEQGVVLYKPENTLNGIYYETSTFVPRDRFFKIEIRCTPMPPGGVRTEYWVDGVEIHWEVCQVPLTTTFTLISQKVYSYEGANLRIRQMYAF